MHELLDGYEVILLDMHHTFMFGVDRFSPSENYAATYYELCGNRLSAEAVNSVISTVHESLMDDYRNPNKLECFPHVAEKLREQRVPESELDLLVEVFASHERGHVPTGYAQCLIQLSESHRLGVVSNLFAPKHYWISELERTGVLEVLEIFVSSSDYSIVKPSPRIFEIALRELAVSRTKVIYIGDSFDADIRGAASAGIDSIWINAEACRETLAPSPAKCVVPELISLTESG